MNLFARIRAWWDRPAVNLDTATWTPGRAPGLSRGTYRWAVDVFGEDAADRLDETVRLANGDRS